jgi:hypothetical protein
MYRQDNGQDNGGGPMRITSFLFSVVAVLCVASPISAQQVMFDKSWSEQRFSLFSGNAYAFDGASLGIKSNSSVSMAFTRLANDQWSNRQANWSWSVDQGVSPTDLTKKGGDDRSISLYFVFLPLDVANGLGRRASVRKLLTSDAARVLVYVWGGDHKRGDVLQSPYLLARGRSLILQTTVTGKSSESVDLAKDYKRIFGGEPGALVGLAVSADSDDTDGAIVAQISDLVLQ